MYFDPEVAGPPEAPLRADVRSEVTPRDPKVEEGDPSLDGLIFGALSQSVRHGSSVALAELEVEAHSIPTPLTGSEKPCERPTSGH